MKAEILKTITRQEVLALLGGEMLDGDGAKRVSVSLVYSFVLGDRAVVVAFVLCAAAGGVDTIVPLFVFLCVKSLLGVRG